MKRIKIMLRIQFVFIFCILWGTTQINLNTYETHSISTSNIAEFDTSIQFGSWGAERYIYTELSFQSPDYINSDSYPFLRFNLTNRPPNYLGTVISLFVDSISNNATIQIFRVEENWEEIPRLTTWDPSKIESIPILTQDISQTGYIKFSVPEKYLNQSSLSLCIITDTPTNLIEFKSAENPSSQFSISKLPQIIWMYYQKSETSTISSNWVSQTLLFIGVAFFVMKFYHTSYIKKRPSYDVSMIRNTNLYHPCDYCKYGNPVSNRFCGFCGKVLLKEKPGKKTYE